MSEENEQKETQEPQDQTPSVPNNPPVIPKPSGTNTVAPEEGANVILSREGEALFEGKVAIGMGANIRIPNEAQQRAGFCVPKEDVMRLINQFRQYKHLTPNKTKFPA